MNKPGSCCSPRAQRGTSMDITPQNVGADLHAHSGLTTPMIALPGAIFLMGTDYARGFPIDGEGPVREVELSSFAIDTFPVTNRDFASFVDTTGYRTEAERFGWSFVFWAHLPKEFFQVLVEDTVAATPWWCKVPDALWKQPEGPGSNIDSRLRDPVVHVS